MARTRIEDISAVEEIDEAEQAAVQGGGLKKKWKKAKTSAEKSSQRALNVAVPITERLISSREDAQNVVENGANQAATTTYKTAEDPS